MNFIEVAGRLLNIAHIVAVERTVGGQTIIHCVGVKVVIIDDDAQYYKKLMSKTGAL